MKNILIKLLLFSLCVIYSHVVIAQDNYLDSLKKVLSTEKEDTNKVNTLDYICDYYWSVSDYENTMQNAKVVLALSTKINYKIGIADGYLNMGLAYGIKKDRISESENFNKALALYKETRNTQQIINCYGWMEQSYFNEEDFGKALECEYADQKIREQTGDKGRIADGFVNIGNVYFLFGNGEELLKNASSALKLYKEINDKSGIAICYLEIGVAYHLIGEYPQALDTLFQALQLLKDANDLHNIANTYSQIGDVYECLGDSAVIRHNNDESIKDYFSAEKNQLVSLKMLQTISFHDPVGIGICYEHLGYINLKLRNLSTSRKYLDSSLAVHQLLDAKKSISRDYLYFQKLIVFRATIKMLTKIISCFIFIMIVQTTKKLPKKLCRCRCNMSLIKKKLL